MLASATINSTKVSDFHPTRDFLLVKPLPRDVVETALGIVIPEGDFPVNGQKQEVSMSPQKALVVAAGPGQSHGVVEGALVPMACSEGDVIYLGGPYMTAIEVWLDGKEYNMVRDRDVIAKASPIAADEMGE